MDGGEVTTKRYQARLENVAENIVDVACLVQAILRGWYIVLIALVLGFAQGAWRMHNFSPSFQASMIVVPSGSEGSGGGGVARAAAGLAQTFGVALPSGGQEVTNIDRFKALLGSVRLAERLQQRYGIMQILYAGQWDEKSASWSRPTGESFERKQQIRAFFNLPTWRPPDLEALAETVQGTLKISRIGSDQPGEGGMMRMSVRRGDPEMALFLLRAIFQEADALLREQDRLHVAEQRSYLEKRLEGATRQEIRQVLLGMLSDAEQKAMLLKSELPYVGRVLEAPFVSTTPSQPVVLTSFTPVAGWLAAAIALSVLLFCVWRGGR